MAPSKASRASHDDSKPETSNSKDKNGHGQGHGHANNHGHGNAPHQSNGKSRRGANSAGSNLRDVTNAATLPSPTPADATASAPAANPSINWSSFDREFLHKYRREHRLKAPTAYASDYHSWVLTQPGSIGLFSPTLLRRKPFRRQTRDELANTIRKHFNCQGVQENDTIVDFIHRVRQGRGCQSGS